MCFTFTPAFTIGVASNNAEDRSHTNIMYFSFFSYLFIGATSNKVNGWYEFVLSNNKQMNHQQGNERLVVPYCCNSTIRQYHIQ